MSLLLPALHPCVYHMGRMQRGNRRLPNSSWPLVHADGGDLCPPAQPYNLHSSARGRPVEDRGQLYITTAGMHARTSWYSWCHRTAAARSGRTASGSQPPCAAACGSAHQSTGLHSRCMSLPVSKSFPSIVTAATYAAARRC